MKIVTKNYILPKILECNKCVQIQSIKILNILKLLYWPLFDIYEK